MINYFIESAIIWSVGYSLYWMVLRPLTFHRWNRVYLLTLLISGALLPLIGMEGEALVETITLPTLSLGIPMLENTVHDVTSRTSWGDRGIVALYVLGSLYVLGKILLHIRAIYKSAQEGERYHKERFTLVVNRNIKVPFSFFSYIFMTPSTQTDEVIWQHETAHARLYHSMDILVSQAIRVLHWFNPIVHLLVRELRNIHEYEADAYVLQFQQKKTYSYILLKHACPEVHLPLASHFNSQIKKRIKMMFKKESSFQSIVLYPLTMLFLVIVMVTTTSNNVFAQVSDSDEVFSKVEQMPYMMSAECQGLEGKELKMCSDRAMLTVLYNHIQYPKDAKDANVGGMAVAQFTVTKRGIVKDVKIVRGVYPSIDEEVIRIVAEELGKQKWMPGMDKGKAVNVQFNLPVRFKLNNDDEDKKEKN